MKKWLMLGLFFLLNVSYATIFMHIDENGNTVYSDTNENSTTKVVVVPLSDDAPVSVSTNQSSGVTIPSKTNADIASDEEEAQNNYTDFSITSPKDGETMQNPVTISVRFDIKPKLRSGDKIQLLLDNRPAGEAVAGTAGMLPWIERGSHQVSAVIIDANQQVIKTSNAITIYVQRAGLNSPARQSLNNVNANKMATVTQPS